MPDVSPTKWHRAHVTWFFETFVLGPTGRDPYRAAYAYLFNSYYEAVGPRHPRPRRGLLTRPSLEAVMAYRAHVNAAMAEACADPAQADLIVLGLHHEQQHQELILTDIKHAFFSNPLLPAYTGTKAAPGKEQPLTYVSVPGGVSFVGHDGSGFCFDNELPRHQVLLRPFR